MATDNKKECKSGQDPKKDNCKPKVDRAALEASKALKQKQLANNETVKKHGKD